MHKAKTNNNFTKFISMLLVVLMLVSIVPITASADPASASFENVSGEGKDIISLAEGREYKASIPISADVDPATITWTMVKDSSKSYVSKELFPNQTEGGALSTWICDDGKTPFFNEVKTSVSDSNGQKTLVAEFSTNDFFYGYDWYTGESYPDNSAPHDEGGAYLDSCGYFKLTATDKDVVLPAVFNEISLPEHVTGEQLNALNNFQITVVAEAIQAGSFANAGAAWAAFAPQP